MRSIAVARSCRYIPQEKDKENAPKKTNGTTCSEPNDRERSAQSAGCGRRTSGVPASTLH